ncbi:serine O-acetyltransferase, partial [bacterium]|nr:serine O-acetyltransferase [bacterium]
PAHVTVAGVPAKIVGKPREDSPALEMDQRLDLSKEAKGENIEVDR